MEPQTYEGVKKRSEKAEQTEFLNGLVAQIDKHVITGESEVFYVWDDEKLKALVELFGHDSFDGSKILAFNYSNHNSSFYRSEASPTFTGTWSIIQLQERIGDIGGGLEFPNNYSSRVVVELDAETIVIYDHEASEEPVVCTACQETEDYQPGGESYGYSCDHEIDEYTFTNYVLMMKRPSADELERIMAHGY